MEYGVKLKTIIAITGQKQEELAQNLGVTFTAFNRWFHGKAEPRAKAQKKIDALLQKVTGVRSAYFQNGMKSLTLKDEAIKAEQKRHKRIVDTILEYPDIRDQLILSLTYHSNKIEGSTLSESETASVIFHNIALKNKTLTEQIEAKNHQTALLYMFDHVQSKKPIDEAFILKIHAILMNSIRGDAGMYRNHGVRIVGSFVPTANHATLAKSMQKFIQQVHQAIKNSSNKNLFIHTCARLHAEFEQIHPFSDGNGRTGRILLNAMLLHENFAPAMIVQNKKAAYYKALNNAQLKEKYEDIEEYITDAVLLGYRAVDRKGR